MKRFATLLTAALLVLGSFGAPQAMEFKASGDWDFGGGYAKNTGNDAFYTKKHGGNPDDPFNFYTRIRTQLEFIASESLKGVLGFEIGTVRWGSNSGNGTMGRSSGGQLDGDGVNIETRYAYINWAVPNTGLTLQMGLQPMALPYAAFGNPILDTQVFAVVGNYQITDTVGITGFWARPFDGDTAGDPAGKRRVDETDMFALTLPLTPEGFAITPYAMYARIGGDSGYWQYRYGLDDGDALGNFNRSSNAWWGGAAFEMSLLDPISLKMDGVYGQLTGRGQNRTFPDLESNEYRGWLLAGLLEYKTDSAIGTPGLLGWYASGDGKNAWKDGKMGRMPIVGVDNAGFAPTALGFPGSNGCLTDSVISATGVGTWGVGLQLAEMSFVEKLSHTVRVAYIRGTNHEDNVKRTGGEIRSGDMNDYVYLTKKDYAVEVDFFSKYELYTNLDVYLETGYIYLNRNEATWGDGHDTSPAWKAQVLFKYHF